MGFFRYALNLQLSMALQCLGALYMERGGRSMLAGTCILLHNGLTTSILIAPQFELKNYEEQTLQGNLAYPSVERG